MKSQLQTKRFTKLLLLCIASVLLPSAARGDLGNWFLATDDFETLFWGHYHDYPELRYWFPYGSADQSYSTVTASSSRAHSGSYSVNYRSSWVYSLGLFPAIQAHAYLANPDPLVYPPDYDPWDTALYQARFVDASVYIWDDYEPGAAPEDFDEGFTFSASGWGEPGPYYTVGLDIGIVPDVSLTHYCVRESSGSYIVTDIERRHGWTQFRATVEGEQLRVYVGDQPAHSCYYNDPHRLANGFGVVRLTPLPASGYSDQGLYFDDWSSVTAVPEPATLSLLAMGGLAMLRRRGR